MGRCNALSQRVGVHRVRMSVTNVRCSAAGAVNVNGGLVSASAGVRRKCMNSSITLGPPGLLFVICGMPPPASRAGGTAEYGARDGPAHAGVLGDTVWSRSWPRPVGPHRFPSVPAAVRFLSCCDRLGLIKNMGCRPVWAGRCVCK